MRRQDADEKADEPFCHEVDTNSLKVCFVTSVAVPDRIQILHRFNFIELF